MNEPQDSLADWLRWKRFDSNWDGLPCLNLLAKSNRPSLKNHPRERRTFAEQAMALTLMGATIAWAKNAVGRGWLHPGGLVIFIKMKEYELAVPALKKQRAAYLKARAWRAVRGHTLDLQNRWRGEAGHQWARHIRWEFLI